MSNQNTLNYAKWLSNRGKRIWIRHVLVPSLTDDDESLTQLSNFIKTINVEKVEVLPYHTMGEVKYQNLKLDYPLEGVEPPSKEVVEKAKQILGVIK